MNRATPWAIWAVAGAALVLAGCQTLCPTKPSPPSPVVIVKPPPPAPTVPKSCVPKSLGPSPRYPDTDAVLRAAPGAADRYQLMAAGRILRQKRLDELEKAVAECR